MTPTAENVRMYVIIVLHVSKDTISPMVIAQITAPHTLSVIQQVNAKAVPQRLIMVAVLNVSDRQLISVWNATRLIIC